MAMMAEEDKPIFWHGFFMATLLYACILLLHILENLK